jgi:hypothetical protein
LGGVKTEVGLKTVEAGVWDGIPINLEEQSALLQAVGSKRTDVIENIDYDQNKHAASG